MADVISAAIEQIRANDTGLTAFVANGTVYRLREPQYTAALGDALAHNTALTELRLVDCGLNDVSARALANALATNTALVVIDLSKVGARAAFKKKFEKKKPPRTS
jgi:hypothetical protein